MLTANQLNDLFQSYNEMYIKTFIDGDNFVRLLENLLTIDDHDSLFGNEIELEILRARIRARRDDVLEFMNSLDRQREHNEVHGDPNANVTEEENGTTGTTPESAAS